MILIEFVLTFSDYDEYFKPSSFANYFYSISTIWIIAVGIHHSYVVNLGKNGKDFIAKFFAINFVVTIRVLLFFIPIVMLMGIFLADAIEYSIYYHIENIFLLFMTAITYYLTAKHIKDTVRFGSF
jgi:hypothetical protein